MDVEAIQHAIGLGRTLHFLFLFFRTFSYFFVLLGKILLKSTKKAMLCELTKKVDHLKKRILPQKVRVIKGTSIG